MPILYPLRGTHKTTDLPDPRTMYLAVDPSTPLSAVTKEFLRCKDTLFAS